MVSGMKARLLDDRVTLTTQFGHSDFVDQSVPRSEAQDGSARMIRLDLKLIDSATLAWSVAGEMSDVTDNFAIGQAFGDGAQLALPGKRMALSSVLNWQHIRLTAAHDDYRSSFGAFANTRFSIRRDGILLSLKSGSGSLRTLHSSLLSSRTDNHSATLEFDLATLAPNLAIDERLPAALLPKYLMIGWRRGSSESLVNGTTERFARNGIEFNGTWETPIGNRPRLLAHPADWRDLRAWSPRRANRPAVAYRAQGRLAVRGRRNDLAELVDPGQRAHRPDARLGRIDCLRRCERPPADDPAER